MSGLEAFMETAQGRRATAASQLATVKPPGMPVPPRLPIALPRLPGAAAAGNALTGGLSDLGGGLAAPPSPASGLPNTSATPSAGPLRIALSLASTASPFRIGPARDLLDPPAGPTGFGRRVPLLPDRPRMSDGLADLFGIDRRLRPLPTADSLGPEPSDAQLAGSLDPVGDEKGPAARENESLFGGRPDKGAPDLDPESAERFDALADRLRALIRLQGDFADIRDRVESGELTQVEGTRLLLDLIDAVAPSDNPRGAPVPGNLRLRQKLQRLATDIFDAADRDEAEAIFSETLGESPALIEDIGQFLVDFVLPFTPVAGEIISAKDAYEGFLAALEAQEEGRTRDALIEAGLAGVSAAEAVPIFGRLVKLTRGGVRAGGSILQMVPDKLGKSSRSGSLSRQTGSSQRIEDGSRKGGIERENSKENKGQRKLPLEVNISLKYKPGWSDAQRAAARRKIEALTNGETVVTKVTRKDQALVKRYRRLLGLDKNVDVDHIIDLQLGGGSSFSNLMALDRSVNRSIGSQIHHKIKNLEPGTVIVKFSITD